VGFTWGGWVTGGDGPEHGGSSGRRRGRQAPGPDCVVQFKQVEGRDQKLKALKDMSAYDRGDFVKKQGWSKMPGQADVDGKVADECARLLVSSS
jgi:hypothetical protein